MGVGGENGLKSRPDQGPVTLGGLRVCPCPQIVPKGSASVHRAGKLIVMFKCIIYYLLTPWCRVLLEKLTGLQLVKKFPAFDGTRRFITALTSVRHLSLSWANPIQSTYPHPTSWRSIIILSTHLRLGLSSGLFPSGFPTKTLYTPLSSAIRATCPGHLIILHFITRTILGEEYRSLSSSLCSLLHSPVTSSLLGPNTFSYTFRFNFLLVIITRFQSGWVARILHSQLIHFRITVSCC